MEKRYYNHKLCFKYSKYENAMKLSVYYGKIKREVGKSPNIA